VGQASSLASSYRSTLFLAYRAQASLSTRDQRFESVSLQRRVLAKLANLTFGGGVPGLGSKCSAPSAPDRRPHAALVTHDPNRTLQAGVPMPPVDAVCETHPGGARPSHHDIQSDPRFADAPNIARTLQRWVRPRKSVRTGLVWGFSCQAVVLGCVGNVLGLHRNRACPDNGWPHSGHPHFTLAGRRPRSGLQRTPRWSKGDANRRSR
jgi:hypothetical protein